MNEYLFTGGVCLGSEDPKKDSWLSLRAAAICIKPESLLRKYLERLKISIQSFNDVFPVISKH